MPNYARLSGPLADRSGWPNLDIAIIGAPCLDAAPLVPTRSEIDEANTMDAQRNFEDRSSLAALKGVNAGGKLVFPQFACSLLLYLGIK